MFREPSGFCNLEPTSPSIVHLHVHGRIFRLKRELLVSKSAKLAILLKESEHEEKSSLSLPDIPEDLKTFDLVERFFNGCELNLSSSNVIPLAHVAHYLDMTEAHSPNNLLHKALTLFEQRVLPSWSESIKAFRSAEQVLKEASFVGLINACMDSIAKKALADPHLLGRSIEHSMEDYINATNSNNKNGQRRISRKPSVHECQSEDLNTLPLSLYELIMLYMIQQGVPSQHIAGSLFQYAKKWAFTGSRGSSVSMYIKMVTQREVIEVVQRLLPDKRSLVPCKLLFKMLRAAFTLQASADCINGFELRIGKQLDEATVEDLLIPCQSYARKMQYDTECIKRILRNFCSIRTSVDDDSSRSIKVAGLMDEYLAVVAGDIDVQKDTFMLFLAEMSVTASLRIQWNSDGIYRAIDTYLEKHKYLTESEREEVCRMLDIHKMSAAAREHAAKNERLPSRVIVQVLSAEILQLRGGIANDRQDLERWGKDKEEEVIACNEEDEVRIEMEEVNGRVKELEKECHRMKREIQIGGRPTLKKDKNLWKQLKKKLGCSSSIHNYDCHVKKKDDESPLINSSGLPSD